MSFSAGSLVVTLQLSSDTEHKKKEFTVEREGAASGMMVDEKCIEIIKHKILQRVFVSSLKIVLARCYNL